MFKEYFCLFFIILNTILTNTSNLLSNINLVKTRKLNIFENQNKLLAICLHL